MQLRRRWPAVKVVLGLAVVAIIGERFARDVLDHRLWQRSLRPNWIVCSGLLYSGGVAFSAAIWQRLLILSGERPSVAATMRAYFLGQTARYLPGKAWAMFLRADLLKDENVPVRSGVVTAFYEVFLTMTGAALSSVFLFLFCAPRDDDGRHGQFLRDLIRLRVPADVEFDRLQLILLSAALLAVVGIPGLPPVFNRLVRRVANGVGAAHPQVEMGWKHLVEGLLLSCTGWAILGVSLACALVAVIGRDLTWSPLRVANIIAVMGVSYVAGFVVIVTPGGLGVREFFLALLLTALLRQAGHSPDEARGSAIVTALLLRVAWTGAELALASLFWGLPLLLPRWLRSPG